MKIRFSDGMEFDTEGPMRVVRKSDGLYVVGGGLLCPVKSHAEAQQIINEYSEKEME